jgi:glycosyltransferase domain-containing protein
LALDARDTLTVVLTLKDRSPFTYRWMRYMHDAGCRHPILIADGGEDAAVESHLRRPESYPNLRYTYLRYPPDRDYATYHRKLADVVERVSTPYALLAENDDFFLIEHIATFIAALDARADLVSCGGQVVNLRLLSTDNLPTGLSSASGYDARADTRDKSVMAEHAVDRLCDFMTSTRRRGLWSSWFHVHRTAALRQAVRLVHVHEFTDPVALEIHVLLALLMTGKYLQLDVPFWVRQRLSSQLSATLDATGTLVERFTRNNSLADLDRSLESFTTLSDDDRGRVRAAIATWFAESAAARKPLLERLARRVLGRFEPLFVRPRPSERPPVRLPAIEKYILE